MNYQQLYYRLFNGITDAIEAIQKQNYGLAKDILISAQCTAEDMYLDMGETEKQEKQEAIENNE